MRQSKAPCNITDGMASLKEPHVHPRHFAWRTSYLGLRKRQVDASRKLTPNHIIDSGTSVGTTGPTSTPHYSSADYQNGLPKEVRGSVGAYLSTINSLGPLLLQVVDSVAEKYDPYRVRHA